MKTALRSGHRRLALVGCVLLLTTGCSSNERDSQGSPTTGSASSSPGYTNEGQDMCALLTDEQVATYLGDDIPEPERSNEHGRPTCTVDGESIDKLEVSLWIPPIRSIITDEAERTINIGKYTGYVETETETSCKINIEGSDKFL